MKAITKELLNRMEQDYDRNPHFRTLNATLARTEIKDLAYIPANAARLKKDFSIEIETHGITAQEKSGRCWAFACLNLMREKVMENCNLDSFELSGNYIAFYDKLEKANNMLEMAIEYADRPLDDRMMEYIINGVWDGGYWSMDVDLVKKYGIVPKEVFPESYQSTHTEKFMFLLNNLLRKDFCILREQMEMGNDVTGLKEEMLSEIYQMECIAFGKPVSTFNFEYRDKDGIYHSVESITPQEFYDEFIGLDLDAYVMVCSEPTYKKKFDQHYIFHYSGSMAESDVDYINISNDQLEDLCIKMLEDGEPVWFSCDALTYGDRQEGVWDPKSFDYNGLFGGIEFDLPRENRIDYQTSRGNHAMLLTGVNLDSKGLPDRWKIENSWGGEVGKNGYFVASEEYFQEYVYEAIILKKYLNADQLALLESEPQRLNPWEG